MLGRFWVLAAATPFFAVGLAWMSITALTAPPFAAVLTFLAVMLIGGLVIVGLERLRPRLRISSDTAMAAVEASVMRTASTFPGNRPNPSAAPEVSTMENRPPPSHSRTPSSLWRDDVGATPSENEESTPPRARWVGIPPRDGAAIMEGQSAVDGFDLRRALAIARRRWWLVALCILGTAGAAFAFSASQEKKYTATASLLLRNAGLEQALLTTPVAQPVVDPTREAETNIKLVLSPTVAARTASALRTPPGTVSNEISVSPQGQTDVVSVEATDHDPHFAARLANTYAQQAIAFRRDTDRAQLLQAQRVLQAQLNAMTAAQRNSSDGQLLGSRNEELKLLASSATGNAQVINPATVPAAPSGPKTKRNVALGIVFGLLLGLGAAAFAERLNRRVRVSKELGDIHGLPVLTDVPESRALRTSSHRVALDENEREAFRMLLARLRYTNLERQIRSVVVTSAGAQEGKTTIAWHLAETAALGGVERVLLIETDMRRPVLAARHGLRADPGLADVLAANLPLSDVIQTVPLWSGNNGRGPSSSMDVIVGGIPPKDPTMLLASPIMSQLLIGLGENYDFMVLDTVPALLLADAMPLMRKVAGVLVVSRVEFTTRDQASMLREELRALNAPTLGLIANRVKADSGQQYGYYPRR